MRSVIAIVCMCLFLSVASNAPINDIKLDANYKVEGTFSGNTAGEGTFHVIIAKNKKKNSFDMIPYVFDGSETVRLKAITFKTQPSIVSFHNNGSQLSLVTKIKSKSEFFNVVDINTKTGDFKKSKNINAKDFSTVLRRKASNILLFTDKEKIKALNISSADIMKTIEVSPSASSEEFFKSLKKGSLDAVNTDDFVANGSISEFRVYEDSGELIITKEEDKDDTTQVIKVPLSGSDRVEAEVKVFSNGEDDYKKSTSYVANGKLIQMKVDRKDMKMKIHSLSDEDSKSIGLNDMKPSHKADGFKDMESFLKQASKGSNSPTVTVNNTNNNNLRVRVDYVNTASYNYHYNWWWHHHWQWDFHRQMMQQQMMLDAQRNIPRFGPNASEDIFQLKRSGDEKVFFEFTISPENAMVDNDNSETVYKDIDKKTYIDELEENSKLKHTSTAFTDYAFRYMAYNKKTKSFVIKESRLND